MAVGAVRIEGRVPVGFGDAVVVQHHLRTQPPRCHGDRGGAELFQFMTVREREPVHRGLGEVVEDRQPKVLVVVLPGAVGDLDEQASWPLDQQRVQAVRGDQVGVDAQPEDAQAIVQVVLPDRPVPRRRRPLEDLGTPDVVDQDVDAAVVTADPVRECPHLTGVEMVDLNRDAVTTQLVDECGGLFDGFGPVVVGLSPYLRSQLRPVQMTVAPASPSAAAIPRPAPRVAPATTATFPCRALPSGVQSIA